MNAKNLIAALSLLTAAGSVLADQSTPFVEHTNVASTKTRAEVRHELVQSVGSNPEFVEYTNANVASSRTRDEVRNEAIQAAKGTQVKGTSFGG